MHKSLDVGERIFLEEEFQRNYFVEFDSGDATDEPFAHRLVPADVQVPDAVELGVGGGLERLAEAEILGLVVVDDHHQLTAVIEPFDLDVVELAGQKVLEPML